MQGTTTVHTALCAHCHEKLELLYALHDVPQEFARDRRGKCALCDFRGALTECRYDPAADKRTAEERAAITAQRRAAAPEFRRTEEEREREKRDWMQANVEKLMRAAASGEI